MKEWSPKTDKSFLMKHMGNISQLAGIKRYEMLDGRAKGIEVAEVVTGSGFDYTVLPGRCLDIASARYKGVPISFRSKAEIAAGAYANEDGLEWLRDFHAGMLTTCGLSNLGIDCYEDKPVYGHQHLCLHGRISHIPATEVCCSGEWVDGEYVMKTSGLMRHSAHAGENLTLRRTVTSRLGERALHIHDEIENEAFAPEPLMLLYHINFGYPLLGEHSRLIINSPTVESSSSLAEQEFDLRFEFHEPEHNCEERCYYYHPKDRGDGKATVAILNDELELGAAITFDLKYLDCLTEWKMLNEGDYVLGLEPGNAFPIGETAVKERGELKYIQPGEIQTADVTIQILDGKEEMDATEKLIMK